jgi:hypothetical protein
MLTKGLRIAPRASASLGATRAVCGETQHLQIGASSVLREPFGKRGATSRRSAGSSRRLFGAHNSAIRGRPRPAVDAATATVAKRSSTFALALETGGAARACCHVLAAAVVAGSMAVPIAVWPVRLACEPPTWARLETWLRSSCLQSHCCVWLRRIAANCECGRRVNTDPPAPVEK